MAKKATVKALVVPVSMTDAYGQDADKVVFSNPKNPKENDLVHQTSRRIGYFERQLQQLRQEIEELEDKKSGPAPMKDSSSAATYQQECKRLKEELVTQRKNSIKEYDELERIYTISLTFLHAANLDCPDYTDAENCDVCYDRHAEAKDTAEAAEEEK